MQSLGCVVLCNSVYSMPIAYHVGSPVFHGALRVCDIVCQPIFHQLTSDIPLTLQTDLVCWLLSLCRNYEEFDLISGVFTLTVHIKCTHQHHYDSKIIYRCFIGSRSPDIILHNTSFAGQGFCSNSRRAGL